ncbi:hypothetical protein SBRCBS47491_006134 [Sporothrix bragantina]|uniref:Zn(2)-C6 fungal-type domain-containing protein n=1 Tax=Sporothrix bragantina TaxID=671064 RepID=A0ABP0C2D7_9PEZI
MQDIISAPATPASPTVTVLASSGLKRSHSPPQSLLSTNKNTGNNSNGNNPRKRGRTACTRCKTRKQKCDEQWPVCSNCETAGAECDKKAVANHGPSASYTRALEERVMALERELAVEKKEKRRRLSHQSSHPSSISGSGSNSASPSTPPPPTTNAINEIVTMIPLGNLEAPAFIGPSSGLSMALNLGEMVQATIWSKAFATAAAATTATGSTTTDSTDKNSSHSRPPISVDALMANSAKEPPPDNLGRRMIDTYLGQLHPRYPFIDRADIWHLHEQRFTLAATAPPDLTRAQRFGIFKLYMIYAIGSTLIALTDKQHSRTATAATTASEKGNNFGSYYLTALQHVAAAREPRTIQNVEAMILLALYHLRESSCHGMWYMVGLAMRTCIDLGMHREAYEVGIPLALVQRRRLLFWTVYSLDRTIAMSLGRPLSITDRQIDVGLPEPNDNGGNSDDPLQGTLFIQLCRLKRIESQIHLSIYRIDKPVAVLARKRDRFYAALAAWKAALPPCFRDFSDSNSSTKAEHSHYLLLHYNRVLRLLLQPFLSTLPPTSPYYGRCLRAAGAICRAHKQLHQTPSYAHSFISVQTVFMAGVTLLYALWTRPQAAWSATLADDIRSCSLVLCVMGERADWVRKFRDTFERLVSAAMEKLQTTGSNLDDAATPECINGQDPTPGIPGLDMSLDDSLPTAETWSATSINEGWPGPPMDTVNEYEAANMAAATSMSMGLGMGMGMGSPTETTSTTAAMLSHQNHQSNNGESWRMADELADWIARDNGVPVWMPDLEMLPNLWSG